MAEYDLSPSTLTRWIKQSKAAVAFTEESRIEEEKELNKLLKENEELKMKNDLLKQIVKLKEKELGLDDKP